jgi:hypothetical protein
MSDAAYCPVCHRVVPHMRSTCPTCGAYLCKRYEFEQLLAAPFEQLESRANQYVLRRLTRMECTLVELERELDSFLAGAARKALPRPV